MMSPTIHFLVSLALIVISSSNAFMTPTATQGTTTTSTKLFMAEGEEVKSAPMVNGEQLEMMLQEWDTPLIIDAYATWYVQYRVHCDYNMRQIDRDRCCVEFKLLYSAS